MPPPGVPTEELLIARFRGHARRLFWSALVLIAVFGATAYFFDNLPAPVENWMLLSASGAAVLLLVVLPYIVWYS
ncbi:PH domain-containing protein, partial [Microbacterium sp. ISL-103]|nr:PH domain-containing protein [Microbacterium sp. ISL-103]